MREYFAIYHRPTDTWSAWNVPSKFGFKPQNEELPRIYSSRSGCKRAVTNFTNYCQQFFKHDLEFCLGLEVVRVAPSFSVVEVVHQQIFSAEKM